MGKSKIFYLCGVEKDTSYFEIASKRLSASINSLDVEMQP